MFYPKLITPIMLEREAKYIALQMRLTNNLSYNIKVDYDPGSDNTILYAANPENKYVQVLFTTEELKMCLDDLHPKIEKAFKTLYSRDLAFIYDDYT